jgi:hypothetical protein
LGTIFGDVPVSFAKELVHNMEDSIWGLRPGWRCGVFMALSCALLQNGWAQELQGMRGGQAARAGIGAPLPIPLVLAGNFGELRSNHFHTGLDFKTQGVEGIPVLAATDGVVSRVKSGPYGYGNALYLNSPDGLTTVYAHLQRFTTSIEAWLREEQYRSEKNEWDSAPRRAFSFNRGDTIGWSGNSGSSGGPHLHFEVRETATQRPINPLLWNLEVADTRAPSFEAIWVLPQPGALVDGKSTPTRLEAGVDAVEISGSVRVAAEAFDRLNAANNVCGVYRMEVKLGGELWFEATLDTLDFGVARDMNAHAYYPVWAREKDQIHRLHRLPGNRLPIYERASRSGELNVPADSSIVMEVKMIDVHGNESFRKVELRGLEHAALEVDARSNRFNLKYDRAFDWVDSTGLRVEIPSGAFYEDSWFPCHSVPGGWQIGSSDLPASKYFLVELPENAGCGARGHVAIRTESSEIEDVIPARLLAGGGLRFESRTPGLYSVACDTLAPVIQVRSNRPSGLPERPNSRALQFEVKDDLSGVASIEAWVDGCWIRMQWDPKKSRAYYLLEDGRHLAGTTQEVVLEAKDESGNVAQWRGAIHWPQ